MLVIIFIYFIFLLFIMHIEDIHLTWTLFLPFQNTYIHTYILKKKKNIKIPGQLHFTFLQAPLRINYLYVIVNLDWSHCLFKLDLYVFFNNIIGSVKRKNKKKLAHMCTACVFACERVLCHCIDGLLWHFILEIWGSK